MWIILNMLMLCSDAVFSTEGPDSAAAKVVYSKARQYRRAMPGARGKVQGMAVIHGVGDCNTIRHSGGLGSSEPRGYRDPMVMCTASLVFA